MDHSLLIIYVGSEGIERFSEKEVPDRECHAVDGRPEGSQGHEEPIHIIGVAKQPEEWEWLLVNFSFWRRWACASSFVRIIMLR